MVFMDSGNCINFRDFYFIKKEKIFQKNYSQLIANYQESTTITNDAKLMNHWYLTSGAGKDLN